VDLKEEWMRSLIDYMKYNETGEAPITPCGNYLYRSIKLYNESGEFKFPTLNFSISGCFVSNNGTRIPPSLILDCQLQNSDRDVYSSLQPQEAQFHLIYSVDFSGANTTTKPTDVRFNTLAYVFPPLAALCTSLFSLLVLGKIQLKDMTLRQGHIKIFSHQNNVTSIIIYCQFSQFLAFTIRAETAISI
jgi:hypothetical protein